MVALRGGLPAVCALRVYLSQRMQIAQLTTMQRRQTDRADEGQGFRDGTPGRPPYRGAWSSF